ncbi:MAG: hypothetical protein AB7Q97_26240 [Gammaproteobacteria bacterium]
MDYVETPGLAGLFATNVDLRGAVDLPLRRQVTMRGLRAVGALPPVPGAGIPSRAP